MGFMAPRMIFFVAYATIFAFLVVYATNIPPLLARRHRRHVRGHRSAAGAWFHDSAPRTPEDLGLVRRLWTQGHHGLPDRHGRGALDIRAAGHPRRVDRRADAHHWRRHAPGGS